MPMTLDEYQIAQKYTMIKMQKQHTTSTEGVDVLQDKPLQDDLSTEGRYTSKVYRFQSKAPTWIATFAPTDALLMEEEAWNIYPKCKTVMKCPYFTKFSLTIETVHKDDNGHSENVHGLNEEQLAAREVEIIDIASSTSNYWSYVIGSSDFDFTQFKSEKTARGPLSDGWQDKCRPVMTAYKLVTIDAPYWGFGYRLEQALLAGERALFIESHRNCFGWIDEWHGMTFPQIRQLEEQYAALSKEINEEEAVMNA
ncbi:hypothetical protein ACFE04_006220 [Oxalis oulophora]